MSNLECDLESNEERPSDMMLGWWDFETARDHNPFDLIFGKKSHKHRINNKIFLGARCTRKPQAQEPYEPSISL
jgi:hypothetical protein